MMGCFFCRRDADGHERWWLEVTGKGDKEGLVPAYAEMLVERGLSALPSRHEDTPLVLPLGKSMKPLTRAAFDTYDREAIFVGAAGRLRLRGDSFAAQADLLEQASAHWLRHTAGSHMADGGADLRTVRDNLRHASLTSTEIFRHTPDDERHRETEEKHRIEW